MNIRYMFVEGVRYEIKWYRNAIGEPVIAYVMRSKDKHIFSEVKGKEIYKEAKERLGI